MALLVKYKLYLIFGGLMSAEALVLFFLLGGSASTPAAAEAAVAEDTKASGGEFFEFELGDFKISNNSVEGSPLRVDCKIFAEIPKEYESNFTEVYEKKKHRVRDAIQAVVRAASYTDVTDPDLGTVKRKIKKSVADVIGGDKPFITQIIISDFQSYEL